MSSNINIKYPVNAARMYQSADNLYPQQQKQQQQCGPKGKVYNIVRNQVSYENEAPKLVYQKNNANIAFAKPPAASNHLAEKRRGSFEDKYAKEEEYNENEDDEEEEEEDDEVPSIQQASKRNGGKNTNKKKKPHKFHFRFEPNKTSLTKIELKDSATSDTQSHASTLLSQAKMNMMNARGDSLKKKSLKKK